ncbi:MAG: hypothetical protein NVSMB10_01120 [Steroidobacteraceae bacterium]
MRVAAAAVLDRAGRILIAQRPAGKHLAGGWEFPGGKLAVDETPAAGLARELREEIGIVIRSPRPLMRLRHRYPAFTVLIDMWVVTRYSGKPLGLDGQALRWCAYEELATVDLLPADRPIVRMLALPERLTGLCSAHYRIADSLGTGDDDGRLRGLSCASIEAAAEAAARGADFIVLDSAAPASQVARLCASTFIPVFVRGGTPAAAFALGASGVNELPH